MAGFSPHEQDLFEVASSVSEPDAPALAGVNVLSMPANEITHGLLRGLNAEPEVAYAERIPARWLSAPPSPDRNLQWGLRATRWFDTPTVDASDVVVGVIDSGVDASHPDFARVIASYDPGTFGKKDVWGHGTHVCGILAALPNDTAGIAGGARCKLAVWKAVSDTPPNGEPYLDEIAYQQALGKALGAGVRVLSLSLSGAQSSRLEQELISSLVAAGVTVVAAMGNEYERGNPTSYPAACEGVLAVGAADEAGRRSPFSNTGRHLGLLAPGSNILSTLPRGSSPKRPETHYGVLSGTSMATPLVAAAAAALASRGPSWTPERIAGRLKATARRVAQMKGRATTSAHGAGLLDIHAALSSR